MNGVIETDAETRAVRALQERGRFGVRLGLARIRALLSALGDPQQELRGALIGGTNGKGSVQALVGSALRAGGIRTGQTPKPHLASYLERMVIDGKAIPGSEFAAVISDTLDAAERLPHRLGPATEFELVTAAAFAWFRRHDVRTAVIEVGLGGRLDATNAWDGGVAAITTVSLDHTEHLGPTLHDIGREKAAIIKRGDLAVSGVRGDGASPIRRRARRLGVPLAEVEPLTVVAMDRGGLTLDAPSHGLLRVSLLGRHQSLNAAVALSVLEALDACGIARLDRGAIVRGFAAARWPGRLELLSLAGDGRAIAADPRKADPDRPDLLLDGAHNPEGAAALARAVDELRPLLSGGRPVVLLGALRDKDVAGILAPLAASVTLRTARIIATTVPDSPRSLDADALATAWRSAAHAEADAEAVPDPATALARAIELGRAEGGPIIVCGSLYLVGFCRARLLAPA